MAGKALKCFDENCVQNIHFFPKKIRALVKKPKKTKKRNGAIFNQKYFFEKNSGNDKSSNQSTKLENLDNSIQFFLLFSNAKGLPQKPLF